MVGLGDQVRLERLWCGAKGMGGNCVFHSWNIMFGSCLICCTFDCQLISIGSMLFCVFVCVLCVCVCVGFLGVFSHQFSAVQEADSSMRFLRNLCSRF